MNSSPSLYLVSSCLMGLCTRYDGKLKSSFACRTRLQGHLWIPVCPEQLGGLPTPREAADIVSGNGADVLKGQARVVTKSGIDVSAAFIHGAEQVLAIASAQPVAGAILKSGSPSCGVSQRMGVTAALLHARGVRLEEF
ncbi:MAG TPA: DUF523 domain-containing protein, partial [Desulfopila sp.]|nr:DUF523 domain-containing protein [Desulfopila sp.]